MKYVIPESIFMGPRGQVDPRSWNAALDAVQQSLLGMAVANDVNDEQDFVLTQVFMECEELRGKNYLEVVTTNRELAKKYGISLRTVSNWRKEGCPFEEGQWAVLDWLAERRYAPAGREREVCNTIEPSEREAKMGRDYGKPPPSRC